MKSFYKIKNEYAFFKNKLESDIKNCQIFKNMIPSEDCYLIEDSYIKELEDYFQDYNLSDVPQNSFKGKNLSNISIPFTLKEPKVINDFKTAFNYIDNNIKFSLINKKFIKKINFNNILKNSTCVVYYAGNGKLIIEFKDTSEKKSLLIFNPLNKYAIIQNVYIILKNQPQIIYLDILCEDNLNIINYNKNVISFKKYKANYLRHISSSHNYIKINNASSENLSSNSYNNFSHTNNFYSHNNINSFNSIPTNHKNNISSISTPDLYKINSIKESSIKKHNISKITNKSLIFNEGLLKIFIYIFYYEKYLSEKKEKSFDEKEKYCLINPKWLTSFKKYYNYDKLYKALKKDKNNSKINYSNLNKKINIILKEYLKKDILDYNKGQLSQDLTDIKNITCFLYKKYDTKFLYEGVIIPIIIMKLIKNWNKKIPIFIKELLFRNNNIIYINKPKLIIGNLDNINIFIPKFVFDYNLSDKIEIEKKKILDSKSIEEYIKLRKCVVNNYKLQILKNENDEEIGKLIIVSNMNHKVKLNYLDIIKTSKKQEKGNLRALTSDNIHNIKNKIDSKHNKKNIQININTNIFSKLPEGELIKTVSDLNSCKIESNDIVDNYSDRKNKNVPIKNRNKNPIFKNEKSEYINNEKKMKLLIEKLTKNNDELQKKLENKLNEIYFKNEEIKKLRNENEELKRDKSDIKKE